MFNTAERQLKKITQIENAEKKTVYRGFTIVTETGRGIRGGKRTLHYVYDSYGTLVWGSKTLKNSKGRIDLMLLWGSKEAPTDEQFWTASK
jgi:hypothetical protein|tara:strand:+ start:541 stop:813 length:273 start_codon:yes stop_codon:yes gene_type:complete